MARYSRHEVARFVTSQNVQRSRRKEVACDWKNRGFLRCTCAAGWIREDAGRIGEDREDAGRMGQDAGRIGEYAGRIRVDVGSIAEDAQRIGEDAGTGTAHGGGMGGGRTRREAGQRAL